MRPGPLARRSLSALTEDDRPTTSRPSDVVIETLVALSSDQINVLAACRLRRVSKETSGKEPYLRASTRRRRWSKEQSREQGSSGSRDLPWPRPLLRGELPTAHGAPRQTKGAGPERVRGEALVFRLAVGPRLA